ncbi:MAG: hypothetical protein ACLPYS_09600 [Vulcanimicrobiaceae bacterium]
MSPRLALAALLVTGTTAALVASTAPQPAAAQGHRYYRWHHAAYGGPWIRAGFYYASAPGFYPGVGWVGYAPPAYGVPSYAVPAYYGPAPGYYAPAPVYYGPPPAYYGPGYGGPNISIGLFFGGGRGWHR